MIYKHAVAVAYCIYAQHGEDAAKIMEKPWNCVFEFLWEPCPVLLSCWIMFSIHVKFTTYYFDHSRFAVQ